MLNEQTIATLNTLKLFGMARGFEERLNSPKHAELSHAEFVGLLVQDEKLQKWKYILDSMTKEELEHPELLERGRIERIAKGSGCPVKDVRELLKQYTQSKKVMKMMKGKSPEKLMKKFGGLAKHS